MHIQKGASVPVAPDAAPSISIKFGTGFVLRMRNKKVSAKSSRYRRKLLCQRNFLSEAGGSHHHRHSNHGADALQPASEVRVLQQVNQRGSMANTHKDNNEIPLRAKEVLPGNRKDFTDYLANRTRFRTCRFCLHHHRTRHGCCRMTNYARSYVAFRCDG